ncbi:Orm1 type endoplasmic reticulum protein [Russula earlei]|uniref:Orm1 type endoplasmic reticulum protein n=1 Tax=Russula earlei TaxID=71964 RepID=A0ACC0U5C9_9AGAM|nr:Orm1 type endoplasmic reticulum protein [Russula earlei]
MSGLNPSSIKLPGLSLHHNKNNPVHTRGRSNSILKVEHVDSSTEETLDQAAYANINAEWVNRKGAWMIHVVLIATGKVVIDAIPGITQNFSWTACSYLMFHWVTGIPFGSELHGGAYDDLTLWEQIDGGAQNTPSKKWLFSVPVGLFLLSTHYTNYDPWLFAINLSALIFALVPKLPIAHRQRLRILFPTHSSGDATPMSNISGTETPPDSFRALPELRITEAQFL